MGAKTGSSTTGSDEAFGDMDIALRTLAKPQRRLVLERMCEHGGPITAPDLAAAIALESAGRASPADSTEALRTLRHVHLPKLTEAGLIEYDRANETATVTEVGSRVLASLPNSLR
ncbi:DUF7344 domain-containing protein [Halalkalicoccus jeotgali]|uniref:DUF7344 domain-containing protein n=1 Tax=Halalkalicoccus jeotgali (strain DSM 18796 / CECT 7217 / JCM 14584 / KCTC 4019 / B3) TaxID=795797 RepID=D8J8V8_HALJB|nr:hypothetical protein [Halalkalicoccus jeotgali]ADJ14293.1 hypothetical protein HacjB3_04510 [Halalkalicoccus jeotgali B3]ELY40555.1 hypothetical protein C497_02872 [Halalkalicoccus jeotgali B3]